MRYLIAIFLLVFMMINTNAQRTCGTMQVHEELLKQDPTYRDRLEAQERHIQQHGAADRGVSSIITIPVVFHIVHNGDAVGTNENLSDALIAAQLDQLNQDFALANSDFSSTPAVFQGLASNTMIQFCMAERTPDCQSSNGIHRYNGGQADWATADINSILKPATIWNRDLCLNIWTVNFDPSSTLLGYAQVPGGPANTDGVVVKYTSVGSLAMPNPVSSNYNQGRTMTHEVGHWLSMYHIWGDDGTACTGSDLCADTPNQADENYGCPTFPTVSCSNGPNGDMFVNYMDYV
ncbi:MAG: zinc metalloprotease, partial [Saprospiraceae bacterium]|nr:zinc metalloprotease [Saprospiraceae bacterium]